MIALQKQKCILKEKQDKKSTSIQSDKRLKCDYMKSEEMQKKKIKINVERQLKRENVKTVQKEKSISMIDDNRLRWSKWKVQE